MAAIVLYSTLATFAYHVFRMNRVHIQIWACEAERKSVATRVLVDVMWRGRKSKCEAFHAFRLTGKVSGTVPFSLLIFSSIVDAVA